MTKIIQIRSQPAPASERLFRRLMISVSVFALIAAVVWTGGFVRGLNSPPRENSIMTIAPYRANGTWVFDDLSAGLVREPFVAGVPEMIDHLVADIPEADKGFRMLFSAKPFPGHQKKLIWNREEAGGNYYRLEEPPMEGWICPAMFQYFRTAPKELFVKAEAMK